MADKEYIVPTEELRGFVVRCMKAVGVTEAHAQDLAELLVAADYRGHYSHGLNRLDMYISDVQNTTSATGSPTILKETAGTALVDGKNVLDVYTVDVESGMTATSGSPVVVKETVATALVDGKDLLGPVVGRFCMDLAIEKAKSAGIGWVSARGSNHFGIAGWYGIHAVKQGMLGMAFTNTSPLLVPSRSKTETLGTNPICCAAPGRDGDSFVLDMATTAVALGKVELAQRKEQPIPEGWAVDANGKSIKDPSKAVGLCPLGGAENTSGYKGYGLSMMVEVFCGILSGSMFGPHVRKWKETHKQADLGQCFVAINPEAFADGFQDRMSDLMDYCRTLEPAEGESEVLVPGDPERNHMKKCDKQGGILYHPNQIIFANELASKLKVAPMITL